MSDDLSGNVLDATLRGFSAGQKLFGRYTLIKILGRGGMGIVWLAHDDELDRDVALKFLPELIIHDRAVLSDLKRETRRSLELTHKNIVRIHDFVHDDQSGCISMEFIDGDTLSNLRSDKENKVFETDEVREWIAQLCDALDYAHNHARIIHRDLKPGNLMVNTRAELKVTDFGIARSLSDSMSLLTMNPGTSGTLVFMSPQQLDGERGTHLDDIYSFGATVYELLTSKPPFYSGDIHRQIREKKPPLMSQRRKELEIGGAQIPLEWEKTVAACLEKDPAKRPQTVRDVAVRLNFATPSSQQVPHTSPLTKSHRRNSFIIATAAAIAVAAFATWWFGVHLPAEKMRSLQQQRMLSGGNVTETGKVTAKTAAEEAKAPQPEAGSIELTSDPIGATVQQGNHILGVTPLSLEHFRAGTSKFTVSALTYAPKTVEISVVPNRMTSVTVVLAKAVIAAHTTTPAESSMFAGTWTGKVKVGMLGTLEATLIVNSAGTSVTQKDRFTRNDPKGERTHEATCDGKTVTWRMGKLSQYGWTLTPNPDMKTAAVTCNGPLTSNSVTFRKEANSENAAETEAQSRQ